MEPKPEIDNKRQAKAALGFGRISIAKSQAPDSGRIDAGKDYELAFRMGCNAIDGEGLAEHHIPKLLKKNPS